MTSSFDFDDNYYNFDSANEFLHNISGVVPSLSPLSEDDQFRNSLGDMNNSWDPGYTEGAVKGKIENSGGIANNEYSNRPIGNGNTGNSLWSDMVSGQEMVAPGNIVSSSMSSGISQDSTNNGMTPLSQHSLTSAHTSPELSVKVEESEDTLAEAKNPVKTKARVSKPQKKDKSSHNMIEKKYRTNINTKILALRDAVPSLRIAAGNKDVSVADLEGLTPASKLNKASVLTKATEYIKHLEQKNDILKEQNLRLQSLIQEANLRPQTIPNQIPVQRGFGYIPPQNEQSFNTTPAQSFSGGTFNSNQNTVNSDNTSYNYNKMLLGGLATVMGTSLIVDDGNDFKGLSALPFSSFLPYSITHPSPLTKQLWDIVKILLVLSTVANLLLPVFLNILKTRKKVTQNTPWHTWLLVNFGFQLPHPCDQNRIENILLMLSGRSDKEFSWTTLFNNYIYLASCEATFELCFLNLIVGSLMISKFPLLSRFLNYNMSLRASLLLNLDYKGDNKSLIRLSKLIHDVDGISMLGSTSFLTRLTNIALHQNINNGLSDGQNYLKYIEFYQESKNDYYNIIFTWRVLEITNELNLAYLQSIASENQENSKNDKQIEKDLDKMEAILSDDISVSYVKKYLTLFKAVVKCDSASELLKSIENNVKKSFAKFDYIIEKQLHDGELSDFSDSEIEVSDTDSDQEPEVSESHRAEYSFNTRKSLISSLNLVSEEQFVVLASSLILYYQQHNPSQTAELLKYLNFSTENVSLSLMAFTALLKVVSNVVDIDVEPTDKGSNVLEQLVRIIRLWVNDDNKKFLDYDLRSSISELIISKGMLLNGVDNDESDEES